MATTIGPVQLLVVAFDEPDFQGHVVKELTRLKDAGLVRVIDALVVMKADDGVISTAQFSDLTTDESTEIGAIAGALLGVGISEEAMEVGALAGAIAGADGHILEEDEIVDVIGEIPPGTAAAVALLEHRWAIGLRDAIVDAGGLPVVDTWVHPMDLVAVGLVGAAEIGAAN